MNCWLVDKRLAKYLNSHRTAIVLADILIFEESHHKSFDPNQPGVIDGWFTFTHDKLAEKCLMSVPSVKKCINRLKDSRILVVDRRGIPCKNYYKVNHDVIRQIERGKIESNKVDFNERF